VLVLPEIVVGQRNGRSWVTTVGQARTLPAAAALPRRSPPRNPGMVAFADGARSGADWELAVSEAVRRIGAGEVEKVVLARDLVAEAPDPVDPRWPLTRLADRYPGCWTFSVDGLLGATPEMLVRLDR